MIGTLLHIVGWTLIGYSISNMPETAVKEYHRLRNLKYENMNPTNKQDIIKHKDKDLIVGVEYKVRK